MGEKRNQMIETEIMQIMDNIEYGFPDELGRNLLEMNPQKYEEEFYEFYYLQTPKELLKSKCGTCWEQVELERNLFEEKRLQVKTYFICTYDKENLPSHTFLTYEKNEKHYWFEHSWGIYKGIHEYESELELLLDIKKKFLKSHNANKEAYTFVYEYQRPSYHLSCDRMYAYMETQKLIKLNAPLYFYHVVNKTADIKKGLLSLQYMYDHQLFSLFDKNTEKYKKRIVKGWNLKKYKGRDEESLTREEVLDALKTFRGEHGASYIYFFRYPLYKELGSKIESLLKVKDIYRININDESVQKKIKDIFYGYEGSNSDNKLLDKTYYENVTKEEYFKEYDDTLEMNFSKLNHIAISFYNDYCPYEFLEKVEEK